MDKKKIIAVIILTLINVLMISLACYYNLRVIPIERVDVHAYQCQSSTQWIIQRDIAITVCRMKYVDIRILENGSASIRGVQLRLSDWTTLMKALAPINNFLLRD